MGPTRWGRVKHRPQRGGRSRGPGPGCRQGGTGREAWWTKCQPAGRRCRQGPSTLLAGPQLPGRPLQVEPLTRGPHLSAPRRGAPRPGPVPPGAGGLALRHLSWPRGGVGLAVPSESCGCRNRSPASGVSGPNEGSCGSRSRGASPAARGGTDALGVLGHFGVLLQWWGTSLLHLWTPLCTPRSGGTNSTHPVFPRAPPAANTPRRPRASASGSPGRGPRTTTAVAGSAPHAPGTAPCGGSCSAECPRMTPACCALVQVFDFKLTEQEMNDILSLDRNLRLCAFDT